MKDLTSLLLAALCLSLTTAKAEDIFSRPVIKKLADRANDYRRSHFRTGLNDSWIRATYYTGVMAMYQATGDSDYLEQCNAWGREQDWGIPKKGNEFHASAAYSLTCAQVWLESYGVEGMRSKIEPLLAFLDDPDAPNVINDPLRWHYENTGLRFVDGLYCTPPALAMLYGVTGEETYLDWMDAYFWEIYGVLYDNEKHLFYRDIRFRPGYSGDIEKHYIRPETIPYEEARTTYIYQETRNGRGVLWSRGNGWAFGGLTRILKYLSPSHGSYPKYKSLFREMAYELRGRQQPDGFWYPNLDDPEDYGSRESSGTAFFTYGIAWGINNGILPAEEFLPVLRKSWPALVSVLSEEGIVQWCQPPAAAPFQVKQEDTHEYATGMFLLAASELYRMADLVSR